MEKKGSNMKESIFEITENMSLASGIYRMRLRGDHGIERPGQFVNVKLDGLFLRRPISVCDVRERDMDIIYKVAGKGTEQMSRMRRGGKLSLLTPLGNGFLTEKSGESPLIIGGGAGVPPLYGLCRALAGQKKNVSVVLGFNSMEEAFYIDEFRALGVNVTIATADGSSGEKGLVSDFLKGRECTSFYACGPTPMLKAVDKVMDSRIEGYMSMEERMGCGFGACMGCSCQTRSGSRRICREGPVFERSEIIWEQK